MGNASTDDRRPAWRLPPASRLAWAVATVSALCLLLAMAWQARREWDQRLESQLARSELFARVLTDHVTRELDAAAAALTDVADACAAAQNPAALTAENLQLLVAPATIVREVTVLNTGGRVLASSAPQEIGLTVDLASLGIAPDDVRGEGRKLIGSWMSGRSLTAASTPRAPTSGSAAPAVAYAVKAPASVGFVPLVSSARSRSGQALWLVAVLNPDAISGAMRLTLSDEHVAAALVHFSTKVLAATNGADGREVPLLPVFADYLPQREHASYVGDGVATGTQVLAFRASRRWPVVVVVEQALLNVRADWWRSIQIVFFVGLLAMGMILGLGALASRSLRARASARAAALRGAQEVARREYEFGVIVRGVQELLFRTDDRGRLTFVNARWDPMGGTALLGRTLESLVPESQRSRVSALFDVSAAEDAPVRHAVATLGAASSVSGAGASHKAGEGHHFDMAVVALHQGGKPVGFVGSAVDITDRLNAQAQLAEELKLSSQLLDLSPLPTSILDFQGRYLRVNRAWEDFTGRSREAVIGTAARASLSETEARVHEDVDRQLRAMGGQARYEASLAHRDGSRRDIMISKAMVPGAAGQPGTILATFVDVSELRSAERATRAARDLAEEASRSKSEFIANISHELRTPLQSIIGFSELGQMRSGAHEKLAAMFGDVHDAGHRMLALVNDLLDVAKLESSVGTFHLERTDLRPLVRDVLHELQPLLSKRQLQVRAELGILPMVAKVDPLRFQQAMRNVLANAIKFSQHAGMIEVLGEVTDDGNLHVAVRDHGPGIPVAELKTIFEAFVQSSKTKDGAGGTGLGLAITSKIITAQGGRIYAENSPGGGSCFHIILPSRGAADTTTDLP